MDILLVLLAIGGLVVAVAMIVLASRTTRIERESDARVEELQALATGSVLFAHDAADEFQHALPSAGAFADFDDEALGVPEAVTASSRGAEPGVSFDRSASAYSFVMTVPAGRARASGSFDMNQRSRS